MRGRLDFKQRCIGGDKRRSVAVGIVDVESIDFSGANDNGRVGVAIG
jgi:hypothetical protein